MDERVQKLGLGTVQFGTRYGISNTTGKTPVEEVKKVLEVARQNGIELIDTASAYGSAEKVLGQNDLSSFRVVSKFMPPDQNQTVSHQLKQSLIELRLDSLYGYLAHRPDHLAKNSKIWEELQSLKRDKFIQKIGFSLNSPKELLNLLQKNIQPDLIQVPYNYFDRRFHELMIELKENGCEIHTRSVFLQGLFFMDIEQLDPYFAELIPLIDDLQRNFENLQGALLKFVLQQPFVDTLVMGVENSEQFIQNLNSVSEADELPKMDKNITESILVPSNWPR